MDKIVSSARSGKVGIKGGFQYVHDKKLKDGSEAWRCRQRGSQCKGRIWIARERCIKEQAHNHPPNFGETGAAEIMEETKKLAENRRKDNP